MRQALFHLFVSIMLVVRIAHILKEGLLCEDIGVATVVAEEVLRKSGFYFHSVHCAMLFFQF